MRWYLTHSKHSTKVIICRKLKRYIMDYGTDVQFFLTKKLVITLNKVTKRQFPVWPLGCPDFLAPWALCFGISAACTRGLIIHFGKCLFFVLQMLQGDTVHWIFMDCHLERTLLPSCGSVACWLSMPPVDGHRRALCRDQKWTRVEM